MNIALLKKEAQEVAARLESRLNTAIEEDRDLTDEETAAEQEDNTRLETLQARLEKAQETAERVSAVGRITIVEDVVEKRENEVAQTPASGQTDGFFNVAEFALSVCRATDPHGPRAVDSRLAAPTNFHQESGDANQTGYMVPAQFREEIWSLVNNNEDVISMVDSEPTNSNQVDMLADETTPWGSTGIQAYWRAEGSQMTPSNLDTDGRSVKLNELYAFCSATEELLQDGPRLNRRLTVGASDAIRWKASDSLFYGNGVGQPLGWFNSAALVSVAKESGQAADTVVAKNVAKMFSRNLNPGRSTWMVNSDVLPELMTMTLGDQPIWTPPSSGFTNAPGGFLFGRPVFLTEHCKTVGDKGDVQFVDPKGYYAAVKQNGVQFAESMHLYFDYNVRAFRWVFRLGGQPHLSAPVGPANGSKTKSHFVTLDVRA